MQTSTLEARVAQLEQQVRRARWLGAFGAVLALVAIAASRKSASTQSLHAGDVTVDDYGIRIASQGHEVVRLDNGGLTFTQSGTTPDGGASTAPESNSVSSFGMRVTRSRPDGDGGAPLRVETELTAGRVELRASNGGLVHLMSDGYGPSMSVQGEEADVLITATQPRYASVSVHAGNARAIHSARRGAGGSDPSEALFYVDDGQGSSQKLSTQKSGKSEATTPR
jgi:hypothetical protein